MAAVALAVSLAARDAGAVLPEFGVSGVTPTDEDYARMGKAGLGATGSR